MSLTLQYSMFLKERLSQTTSPEVPSLHKRISKTPHISQTLRSRFSNIYFEKATASWPPCFCTPNIRSAAVLQNGFNDITRVAGVVWLWFRRFQSAGWWLETTYVAACCCEHENITELLQPWQRLVTKLTKLPVNLVLDLVFQATKSWWYSLGDTVSEVVVYFDFHFYSTLLFYSLKYGTHSNMAI